MAGVPQKKLGLEVTSEKVEGRGQVNSHHMIVVGTDRARMALAANRLAEVGAGSRTGVRGRSWCWSNCPLRA